jgi:hypothetical protein
LNPPGVEGLVEFLPLGGWRAASGLRSPNPILSSKVFFWFNSFVFDFARPLISAGASSGEHSIMFVEHGKIGSSRGGSLLAIRASSG